MSKKVDKNKKIEIRNYVIALISLVIIVVAFLRLGDVGYFIDNFIKNIIGLVPTYFVYMASIALFVYVLFNGYFLSFKSRYVIGSLFFFVGIMLLFAGLDTNTSGFDAINFSIIGTSNLGFIQLIIYGIVSQLIGSVGNYILAVVLMIIGLVIYFMISISTHLKNQKDNIGQIHQNYQQKNVQRKQARANKKPVKDFFDNEENSEKEYTPRKIIKAHKPKEVVVDAKIVELDSDDCLREATDTKIEKNVEVKEIEIFKNIDNPSKDYHLPSFTLLQNPIQNDSDLVNKKYAENKAKLLQTFFQEFNLDAQISNINIGPSITKFELTLSPGIRVNRIANLADDIKMALAVKEIRIEAPIPGKSAVGIEIPNQKNKIITLKEVLNDINYSKENKLVIGLGKDINGKAIYTSLDKMPHLLVAGSTGSGKSVCINGIIVSILMNAHYDEVKLVLIDPKKVELNIYNDIPHLLTPVISDPKQASTALKKIVDEMDRRYQVLAQYHMKNIEKYNEYVDDFNKKLKDDKLKLEKLPYIVVVIDELADLMMVSPKEVEESIMRITQMARAAGIHLIVATQRPSTDVITGIIKANIPSRIAFAVSSSIDSRTILDMSGAEKLLGKGDMLFYPSGVSNPKRVQGAFLSDEEVAKVVYDIKKQHILNKEENNFINEEILKGDSESFVSEDSLYNDVEEFVSKQDNISISRLQREFKIGYNRAANLIDDLEKNGIISGQNGSKPRDVLIKNEELE